ncbi:hypothetical protein [Absidia glauca]|uniref:Uncharacterized protein n=1 Tax=Absidia glauca TaxID=4829 RepID=A0A163MDG8_ABSGL|nr:hypothetical protein [Absidia glauca]
MTLKDDTILMSNRVAVVTGGSKGIGLAVSTALVAREVKVVIGDVLTEQGQEAVNDLNQTAGYNEAAIFQYCDVRRYDDLKKLFELAETRFGGVDIAAMCASVGSNLDGIFQDPMEDEAERSILDVNIGGVIKGNRVAVMHMFKRGGGCIINTASMAGLMGDTAFASYASTKRAVMGWTQSLEQLRTVNIRVNAETNTARRRSSIEESRHPCFNVKDASPQISMHLVVEAFLACITNHEYAGETLMVTPSGFLAYPQAELPESCVSESMVQALLDYYPKASEMNKQQLMSATQLYFSKL